MSQKTKREKTIKRWIVIPKWLADRIAELAERDHRSEKQQIEFMLAEHARETEAASSKSTTA